MNSEDPYNAESLRENRSFQELFSTPRPQARTVAITGYPEILAYRLPIALPLEDIQRLGDRLASLVWQMDGEPADSARILAATKRSIAGGAK